MRNFLAFDIGGTLLKYGVLTENGDFIIKDNIPTEAQLGGSEVLKKVKKLGQQLISEYNISGICISTAGQVDSVKGEIVYASSLIPNYTGMQVKKKLETYFNLPVQVENDVNCVGLAESWIGKGKNVKSLFCLTIGTGIGGSYVIDNTLHTGHSFSGGEIGYIPIEGDQFQELASTRTLVDNVAKRKKVDRKELNGKIVFELAKNGDEIANEEIERLVYYLSKGIATVTYMMNPEMIVIGGGITNQKEFLYPLIEKQLKKDIIPAILNKTKVKFAGNLNDAGMIGALRHFLLLESLEPYNKITTLIEANRRKLTKGENMIATYILKNMGDVPNHTISEMAKKINVSESMITRFCQKLDIGSYSNLRFMAKESTIGTRLHDKIESTTLKDVKEGYISILNNLETLNLSFDIKKLTENFHAFSKLFLYGTGEMAVIVELLKFKLMQLGISVDAFSSSHEMGASKRILDSDTVVVGISLSGYNKEIIHILEYAKRQGSMSIGVTSQQDSPLTRTADANLFLSSTEELDEVTSAISEVSILYLLEVLFKELQEPNLVDIGTNI